MALNRDFTDIASQPQPQPYQAINPGFLARDGDPRPSRHQKAVASGFKTQPVEVQPFRPWNIGRRDPKGTQYRIGSSSSQDKLLPQQNPSRTLSQSYGADSLSSMLSQDAQPFDIPLSLNTKATSVTTESSCCSCFSSKSVKDTIQSCENEDELMRALDSTFKRSSINDIRDGLDQINDTKLAEKGYQSLILKCVSLFSKTQPQSIKGLFREGEYHRSPSRSLTLKLNLSQFQPDLTHLKQGLKLALREGGTKHATLDAIDEAIRPDTPPQVLYLVTEDPDDVFLDDPPPYPGGGKPDEKQIVNTEPSPQPSAPLKHEYEGDDFSSW